MSDIGYGVDAYGEGVYGAAGVATGDRIVLDPIEIADGRVQLSLNSGEIRVGPEGPDWGEAAIEAFMAEQDIGQVPADFRIPNRQVRIPLLLGAQGPGFEAARRSLQAKVGLFQREGGWVKRNNLYADVVNASLVMPDKWGHRELEPDVILTLEVLPDFYGDEIDLGLQVEVTNPTLIAVKTGILGDCPGRVRIVLTEFQGQSQRGTIWGWRSRHYSAADTAQLRYRAQDMDPLDTATVVSLSGSVSGQVVRHQLVATDWTPVLGTDIADGPLSHTGTYRVLARVYTPTVDNTIEVRFVWDVGDLTGPTENGPWSIPANNGFYLADLGEVTLDAAPVGEHRWQGQVQARATPYAGDLSVDELWFVPVDEGTGLLRSSLTPSSSFIAYTARDTFSQGGGALTGKAATTGGVWTATGDADDFQVVGTGGGPANRTAVSDPAYNAGRFVRLGANNFTDIAVQLEHARSVVTGTGTMSGVLARWNGPNDYVFGGTSADPDASYAAVEVRVGGAVAWARTVSLEGSLGVSQVWTFRLLVNVQGQLALWAWPAGGGPGQPLITGQHPSLAAGGALATGGIGMYDSQISAVPNTRSYDNFAAWVPVSDAVMFPNRSLEVRTEGVFREAVEATRYGELADVEGDLPRIPVAGLEGRFSELFVKASRGDFGGLPDSGVDNLVESIFYRPSYLFPREP